MNPFDSLPPGGAELVLAYSGVAALVFLCLGIAQIDRKGSTPKALAPVAPAALAWLYCPSGHAKVLGDHDWSCPICGAQMVAQTADRALWAAMEAA